MFAIALPVSEALFRGDGLKDAVYLSVALPVTGIALLLAATLDLHFSDVGKNVVALNIGFAVLVASVGAYAHGSLQSLSVLDPELLKLVVVAFAITFTSKTVANQLSLERIHGLELMLASVVDDASH